MKKIEPVIVDQSAHPWEGWEDSDLAARSAIRWKLLISGERTPSCGLVTGIAEIPPGQKLLLHRHEPHETYYVVAGAGRMYLGGRAEEIGPGCAVYIPAHAQHAVECVGEEPLVFVFSFAWDRFDQVRYHFDE